MTFGHLASAGLAVIATLAAALPAAADQTVPAATEEQNRPCADRSKVIARLAERYGETLQSLGLNDDSSVLEVYASEDTGTWTILITRTDGMACLIASGQAWEKLARPLTPPGDDA